LPFPNWIVVWNDSADVDLPGARFLKPAEEVFAKPRVSFEGARTFLALSRMRRAVAPFVPGLKEPLSVRKPMDPAEPAPQTPVSEVRPRVMTAHAVLPGLALPYGLTIWTGVTNSYRRRFWSLPRLREGGRMVNMLQLAPSMEWNEASEIPA
jgi:hypothetical protein